MTEKVMRAEIVNLCETGEPGMIAVWVDDNDPEPYYLTEWEDGDDPLWAQGLAYIAEHDPTVVQQLAAAQACIAELEERVSDETDACLYWESGCRKQWDEIAGWKGRCERLRVVVRAAKTLCYLRGEFSDTEDALGALESGDLGEPPTAEEIAHMERVEAKEAGDDHIQR